MTVNKGTRTAIYKAASTRVRRAACFWAEQRNVDPDDLILRWGLAVAFTNPARAADVAGKNYNADLTAYDTLAVFADEYVQEHDLDRTAGKSIFGSEVETK